MKKHILTGAAACLALASCKIPMPPEGGDILSEGARSRIPMGWSGGHGHGAVVPNWIASFNDPELTRLVFPEEGFGEEPEGALLEDEVVAPTRVLDLLMGRMDAPAHPDLDQCAQVQGKAQPARGEDEGPAHPTPLEPVKSLAGGDTGEPRDQGLGDPASEAGIPEVGEGVDEGGEAFENGRFPGLFEPEVRLSEGLKEVQGEEPAHEVEGDRRQQREQRQRFQHALQGAPGGGRLCGIRRDVDQA